MSADLGRRVRVVHAAGYHGREGRIIGVATQAGMDVVVEFDSGGVAEFREWELRIGPKSDLPPRHRTRADEYLAGNVEPQQ